MPVHPGRRRPRMRSLAGFVLAAAAVGALVGWSSEPATATPPVLAPRADELSIFGQSITEIQWHVFPAAARPGEVVHVRVFIPKPKPTPTPLDDTGGLFVPPSGPAATPAPAAATPCLVAFAFISDLGHPACGQVIQAESAFGVDLVVQPGTQWGSDPIVAWTPRTATAALLVAPQQVTFRLPFVATRSAQPPLWIR